MEIYNERPGALTTYLFVTSLRPFKFFWQLSNEFPDVLRTSLQLTERGLLPMSIIRHMMHVSLVVMLIAGGVP